MGGPLKLSRLTLLALLSTPALTLAGEPPAVSARVSAGAGVDTNPTRDFLPNPVTDAYVSATGELGLAYGTRRAEVSATYGIGARQYLLESQPPQTLVQELAARGSYLLVGPIAVGADGSIKDRRGTDHPYSDLEGGARLTFLPDDASTVYLRAGGERFLYREDYPYSYATWAFSAGGTYRFNRHHSILVGVGYEPRRYNSPVQVDVSTLDRSLHRADSVLLANASYSYRGPFQATLSYGYVGEDSNSFGETVYRHRVNLLVGVRLPWEVTVLAQGNLQFARYPDEVFLAEQVALLQDDETTNSVSLKLVRPLGKGFDFELKAATYYAALPHNQLTYQRWLAGAAVSWRWR